MPVLKDSVNPVCVSLHDIRTKGRESIEELSILVWSKEIMSYLG